MQVLLIMFSLSSLNVWLQLPGEKARGRKLENLKNEVASLEAAVQAASQEYTRVKQRNLQVPTLLLLAVHCTHHHTALLQRQ